MTISRVGCKRSRSGSDGHFWGINFCGGCEGRGRERRQRGLQSW